MVTCSTPFHLRHSLKASHALWPNGLFEEQNKNFGTHSRVFLHDILEIRSFQLYFFVYTHNTQPVSPQHTSPYELVFHAQLRNPLNFQLNLLEVHFVNVLQKTVLICFLVLIINQLTWICCFIAFCWNQFILSFSLLKQKICNVFQKFTKANWKIKLLCTNNAKITRPW